MLTKLLIDTEEESEEEEHPSALAAFLRALVLRGDPPCALVALLSLEHARLAQEGHGGGRGSRRTACGGGPSWMRTALCCCPRSGP
jgi:hypothetical protein